MKSVRITVSAVMVGLFAAFSHAETRAFPVPWVAKDSPPNIVFTDLPGSGTVKIFTVAGDEVISLAIQPGQNQISWPVVNAAGRKLASGVYFYLVEGSGSETKGKLVVIR